MQWRSASQLSTVQAQQLEALASLLSPPRSAQPRSDVVLPADPAASAPQLVQQAAAASPLLPPRRHLGGGFTGGVSASPSALLAVQASAPTLLQPQQPPGHSRHPSPQHSPASRPGGQQYMMAARWAAPPRSRLAMLLPCSEPRTLHPGSASAAAPPLPLHSPSLRSLLVPAVSFSLSARGGVSSASAERSPAGADSRGVSHGRRAPHTACSVSQAERERAKEACMHDALGHSAGGSNGRVHHSRP